MRPVRRPAFPLALFDEPDDATRWIGGWLKKIVVPHRAAGAPPLAAVFDIDATLLNRAGAIEPVVALFDLCARLGIARYIVTARREVARAYTLEELELLGVRDFGGSAHLFMLADGASLRGNEMRRRVGMSKRRARKQIAKQYQIALHVGDQWTDHFSVDEQPETLAGIDGGMVFFDPHDDSLHLKLVLT